MKRRTMNYGAMPTEEEFREAFELEVPQGTFDVSHGTESRKDDRARAGEYTASELWAECNRLARNQSEESMSWLSDILGTLGFEWI